MGIIANHANPKTLHTLYLDGCEWIDDFGILALVNGKLHEPGGASNLEILSLSECRNIWCPSVSNIKKFKWLWHLNLLGCVNVSDEGINALVSSSTSLKHLNIGGTGISSLGIDELVRNCKITLLEVIITGCKKLKNSDQDLLRQHGLSV